MTSRLPLGQALKSQGIRASRRLVTLSEHHCTGRAVCIGHNHIDIVLTLSQRARTVSAAETFLKEMVRGSPVCQLGFPPTKLLIFTNISSTASATTAHISKLGNLGWLSFGIPRLFPGHNCCAEQRHLQVARWCRTVRKTNCYKRILYRDLLRSVHT